jgi:ATP-binding protein involved in chromosome partitioning
LAVASGKGGVGKSTVAVGLALALDRLGHRVGLLDADLYGPDVPRMMGLSRLKDARTLTLWSREDAAKKSSPIERHGIKVWSTQFLVGEGQPLTLGSSLAGLLLDRAFQSVDWGDLDWLIVDLPPGTADVQQHLIGLGLSGAILVVTPQDVAHLDGKKVHALFETAEVPIIGAVENMTPVTCPCCGSEIELFHPTTAERSIWALGVPCLARIPFNSQLAQVAEVGESENEDADGRQEFATIFDLLAMTVVGAFPSAS